MKLDILVFSAHPDDAELGCGGTIAQAVAIGKKVGIADLTRGELGTRGTVEIREQEARAASEVLGLAVRENRGFRDGFFVNDETHQLVMVELVRKYQPEIVLAAAPDDRHPDHPRAANLILESCFLSGLTKIETIHQGIHQEPWRPSVVYHYIQSIYLTPTFVTDVSSHWDTKMKAIRCYGSQFSSGGDDPETYISNPRFMRMVESRAIELGHSIGANYGEGFIANRNLGIKDLFDLL